MLDSKKLSISKSNTRDCTYAVKEGQRKLSGHLLTDGEPHTTVIRAPLQLRITSPSPSVDSRGEYASGSSFEYQRSQPLLRQRQATSNTTNNINHLTLQIRCLRTVICAFHLFKLSSTTCKLLNIVTMRLAIFSTKPYDKKYLDAEQKSNGGLASGVDITYHVLPLNGQTVHLAQGAEAVCVFVNDCLSAEVIVALSPSWSPSYFAAVCRV